MPPNVFNWREPFLAALRVYPVIQHACDVVVIERSTATKAWQRDKEFKAAMDEAMEAGIDRAEQEAFRRAVVGYEEPVVHQGRLSFVYERYLDADGEEKYRQVLDDKGQPVPLTIRKHSDALLAKVLSARRQAYRTERTELTSPDGSMSPMDETTRAARVSQLLEAAKLRKLAEDMG